jgi:hypothetical protein
MERLHSHYNTVLATTLVVYQVYLNQSDSLKKVEFVSHGLNTRRPSLESAEARLKDLKVVSKSRPNIMVNSRNHTLQQRGRHRSQFLSILAMFVV